MKKFVLALTSTVLLGNARALADTQTFNAYGAIIVPEQGVSMNIAPSLAFPGFTLYTTGLLQLSILAIRISSRGSTCRRT
jgi:hypothetical protein